jgi:hypothetical protein
MFPVSAEPIRRGLAYTGGRPHHQTTQLRSLVGAGGGTLLLLVGAADDAAGRHA